MDIQKAKDMALADAIETAVRAERKNIIYKRIIIAMGIALALAIGGMICF